MRPDLCDSCYSLWSQYSMMGNYLFTYLFLAVTLISIDLFCKFERKQLRGEKSKESSKF